MRRLQHGDRVCVFGWANGAPLRGARGSVMRASTTVGERERLLVLLDRMHHDIGIIQVSPGDVVRLSAAEDPAKRQLGRRQRARRFRAMTTPLRWDPEAGQWQTGREYQDEVEHAAFVLEQFGANLRRLRRAVPLTQTELADRALIDRDEISRLERGAQEPGLILLTTLARALAVPAASLAAGTDSPRCD